MATSQSQYLKLKSDCVSVFPISVNRDNDAYARVLTEQNIAKLVKAVSHKSSYVIDYDTEKNILQFVIEGYYFKVIISDILNIFKSKELHAHIDLETYNTSDETTDDSKLITKLVGSDIDEQGTSRFTGVTFSESSHNEDYLSSNPQHYCLHVLNIDGKGIGSIPVNSLQINGINHIIDGGIID